MQLGAQPRKLPPIFNLQDCGGTTKTLEAAQRQIAAMLPQVNDIRRQSIPASEIILGMNCGGSDGNSGITANPAYRRGQRYDRGGRRNIDPHRNARGLRG